MTKIITVALMRDIDQQIAREEISYSRMVEILNEKAIEHSDQQNASLLQRIAELEGESKWIPVSESLPKFNHEYETTVDWEDNLPVCSSFNMFDVKTWKWLQPGTEDEEAGTIVAWKENTPPMPYKVAPVDFIIPGLISVDEFERVVYGQCVHGENMANCDKCNPPQP